MNAARGETQELAPRSGTARRDALLIAGAFLAWAVCFDAAMWVLEREMLPAGAMRWVVAGLPSLAALLLLVVYTRYLRRIDELQRLIQLQAMGWGMGGGFFAICGYLLFEQIGALSLDVGTLAVSMPVLFAIGILVGWMRYR